MYMVPGGALVVEDCAVVFPRLRWGEFAEVVGGAGAWNWLWWRWEW